MKCSSGCSCSPVTRCDELWFEDGNLVLQAQHTQYKVHRSLMANRSDFFRDMLTLPCATEGTEAAPLFLPDVSEKHFTVLMKFLYSQWGDDLKFTTDDWLSVVRLAHRFQFPSVLRVATSKCSDLAPDLKLYWAETLNITSWSLPARRAAVLSFDASGDPSDLYNTIWPKIYRARDAVAQARLTHMQRCITARNALPDPPPPFCEHTMSALAIVLPHTPRKHLLSAYFKALSEGAQCKSGPGCAMFDEEMMLRWLPAEEIEYEIIDESWCSNTHRREKYWETNGVERPHPVMPAGAVTLLTSQPMGILRFVTNILYTL
ncbi:hypothetical protein EXIGLDRAFT_836459 [Exidia glandulosa HHB12029]|uniref:BTB domain-containing protein n=1 Tax=Exidia glandulosa HHB12029 TaxID=1314781 RepID=A0A165HTY6_EXIGL|nr:hypothetical protein EXIGLDRAFT_836459 [Exidia glandulosa HHB12029]